MPGYKTKVWDGTQWVDIANSVPDLSGYWAKSEYPGRNRIINGGFDCWQRGTSPTVTSGAYLADRWRSVFDGSGSTRSCSAQTFTLGSAPVAGYEGTTFMRYAQSVAGTGGTYTWLSQLIESVRTFAGQRITVSFWAKADANLTLPSVVLRQFFGSGGSPSSPVDTTVTTNTAVTTAWKRFAFSVDVPSIAGKQLGTTDNSYLEVAFSLPVNTTYTFDVWGVQVENGSAATPFEVEPYETTLRKCQRYYRELTAFGIDGYCAGAGASFEIGISVLLTPQMRIGPTPTFGSVIATNNTSLTQFKWSTFTPNQNAILFQVTPSAAGRTYLYQTVFLSAEL